MRFQARLAGVLCGTAIFLAGCVINVHREQRTATVAPETAAQGLRIDTHNGRVTVTAGDDAEIFITAELKAQTTERLAQMKVVAEQDESGTLVIAPVPPGGAGGAAGRWWSNEGCTIDVALPRSATAAGVRVKTNNGRITISGAAGALDLRTSNGGIIVRGAAGEVVADTSNGKIELTDVHGPVKADTSNGRVLVRLTPDGEGPVEVDTSNGSVTLEVSPAYTGELAMSTSNGSIRVPSEARRSGGRRSGTVVLGRGGDGGPKSSIATSNGNISVQVFEID